MKCKILTICSVSGEFVQTRKLICVVLMMLLHVVPTLTEDLDLIDSFIHESVRSKFELDGNWDSSDTSKTNLFAHILLLKYGGLDGKLNSSELDIFINSARNVNVNSSFVSYSSSNDTLRCQDDDKLCMVRKTCLTAVDIFYLHNIKQDEVLNVTGFTKILPTLVYALQQSNCIAISDNSTTVARPKHKPPVEQVWGFGFLCVTIINLCALLGMVFIPLAKKAFYKSLLMFMVALGVGTLTGSSLLFLIPECFGLTQEDSPYKDEYIWKATTVIGGIYLFFLTERILQSIMDKRGEVEIHKDHVGSIKLASRTRHDSTTMNMSFDVPETVPDKKQPTKRSNLSHIDTNESQISASSKISDLETNNLVLPHIPSSQSQMSQQSQQPLLDENSRQIQLGINDNEVFTLPTEKRNGHGHTHGINPNSLSKQPIKSVAWMIIFGDGLHNFIDGLSIGAAFSQSILAGISVSLAILCEELPHELGDFAILLNSGMPVKQALLYNFLSACMCYFGLIIGILIGEFTTGATWIFAIAGGMFLYISLVDMLPEVNHAAQEEIQATGKSTRVFLIQNCGLLTGYGIMLLLAQFTGLIDLGE